MKYEVIKEFIDRDTLKEIGVGEVITCADSARAERLLKYGYVKEVGEPITAKEDEPQAEEKPKSKAPAKKTPAKRSTKKKA